MPTLSTEAEGNTASSVIASRWRAPRGQRPCACTEPPCARTGRSRARPSGRSPGGPLRERRGGTPEMNERGKSDNLVVPAKPPNNAGEPAAEAVEGRRLAEGNTARPTRPGRSAGQGVPSGLDRVREVARRDKDARFTALLHHVDLDRLWAAYVAINPKAAPGVDQVTWDAYGQDLRENLEDLLRRVHSGAYRASPSRRVYIPKPDGRQRPLGIATVTSYCPPAAVCRNVPGWWWSGRVAGPAGMSMSSGADISGGQLSGGEAWCAGLRG